MRRTADRRAQATVEWLTIMVVIGAVVVGAARWQDSLQPRHLAAALASAGTAAGISDQAVADALAGQTGALSPLGVEAWLNEDNPSTAPARFAAAVATTLHTRHPGWGRDLELAGAPIRGTRTIGIVHTIGPVEARVVSFDEEQHRTGAPALSDRAGAAGTSLAWQGAGSLARRIARPLGLVVGAVQLAAGLLDSSAEGLPAGVRAGDIIVCRRATIDIHGGPLPHRRSASGWRTGVLRNGRLILDAVVATDPCGSPADA